MPTAARMITAVIFAIVAYYTSNEAKTLMPEGTPVAVFTPWAMFVSALCAWRVIGRLIGRGYANSINTGVYAMVCAMFFVCLLFAIVEMIRLSMKFRYDGPMEAIVGIFEIILEYAPMFAHPPIAIALVVGAVSSGLIGEWAHRKWG